MFFGPSHSILTLKLKTVFRLQLLRKKNEIILNILQPRSFSKTRAAAGGPSTPKFSFNERAKFIIVYGPALYMQLWVKVIKPFELKAYKNLFRI